MRWVRVVRGSLIGAMGAGLALAPTAAAAWCLSPGNYAAFWGAGFPERRIAVYMAVGADSSFLHSQLTREQGETVLRRVIAVHNETIGTPTLYYAGTTDAELDAEGGLRERPRGIVVDSFPCTEAEPAPSCAAGQLACTVHGGNADDEVAKARVTLLPPLCIDVDVVWGIERGDGKDVTRVLLHEFGHALGLGHTGDTQCAGPSDGGKVGVMRRIVGDADPYERAWRSDDIAALREVHGGALRHGVYMWADGAFPAAPAEAERVAICAEMRTPPALTSMVAEDGPRATLWMGFTDAEDRVVVRAWDGAGFVVPVGGAVVDPSPAGVSSAPVGLAHSDADGVAAPVLMAVWSSGDSRTERANRLRWGVRALAGGAWEYGYFVTPSGDAQTANRVAVGYDAVNERFLVVSVDDAAEPYVIVAEPDGTQVATVFPGAGEMAPIYAFDIGAPVCRAAEEGSRCILPFTSGNHFLLSTEAVLQPGWLELVVIGDSVVLDGRSEKGVLGGHGLIDLAGGFGELRGAAGEQRFALADGAAVPVVAGEVLAGGDWPLRIGSHSLAAGETTYRVVGRRLAACGDGVVDCGEGCDDGDVRDGDGCSAVCAIEEAGTTGANTTEASPTGEAGVGSSTGVVEGSSEGAVNEGSGDDTGCGCATGGAGPLVVLLLALRRRRGRHIAGCSRSRTGTGT